MHLVIVESPAKARIIAGYLGKDYHVLASYGHVRDIDTKDKKSVDPENHFRIVWSKNKNTKHLAAIQKQSRKAQSVILATDPDREGEAIAWHIAESIKEQGFNHKPISRIAFHSITKKSITDAIKNPGNINMALVEAYLARRTLDYLVGFSLSPILWRKLPGARSAGRVQSAALRIITQREEQREVFQKEHYWSLEARFAQEQKEKKKTFSANLHSWKKQKISKQFPKDAKDVQIVEKALRNCSFHVEKIISKEKNYHPHPPLITSTLQQEAHNQLGLTAAHTMKIAQNLYEKGHITYMRTDNVSLSQDALTDVRAYILKKMGKDYLSIKVRQYKSKVRNAQEAHEAIRPTNLSRAFSYENTATEKLYRLIHARAVASQMASARVQHVQVQVCDQKKEAFFNAHGEHLIFDGYWRLIPRGKSLEIEEKMALFAHLKEGMSVAMTTLKSQEHWTEPPARFTEASLIKYLEEHGIGRPSTYASTLSTLKDRSYVDLEKKALFPTDYGRLVSCFLFLYFETYVDEHFTASMEEKLDTISRGEEQRLEMLTSFWNVFDAKVQEAQKIDKRDILEAFNDKIAHYAFGVSPQGEPCRKCPKCAKDLSIKTGKNGAFVGCSAYPDCVYTRPLNTSPEDHDRQEQEHSDRILGRHPQTGEDVFYKVGPYGPYVQTKSDDTLKRVSVPSKMREKSLTLEQAVLLLELPRKIGVHPTTQKDIFVGIGRYGSYVRCEKQYGRLDPDEDLFAVGLNRAVILLEKKKERQSSAIKLLGDHPDDHKPVELFKGRYGFYVRHLRVNASLKDDDIAETITLKQALSLLEKAAQKTSQKKKK